MTSEASEESKEHQDTALNHTSPSPKVVIVGGGPAGLLASILLFNNVSGIESITVLEKAAQPDEWSSKSYSMVCGERGQAALSRAGPGCIESALEIGNVRESIYKMDGANGELITIPRRQSTPGIGFSRPLLVECLESFASDTCHGVTVKRGAGVAKITQEQGEGLADSGYLKVHLDDGTSIPATHVIGADGKWSKVRQSFPFLNTQATMVTCPSFGVSLYVPPSAAIVSDWKADGTPPECMFYIIASHLPPAAGSGMSLSMVCTDQTVEKYPWLDPPADLKPGEYGKGGWMDDHSAIPNGEKFVHSLSRHLEKLFQEVIPAFHALLSKEVYSSARINRRVTWLKMEGRGKEVSYATEDGRVALVGDAAHAMTPSMGEGGNSAMESALKLVDAIISAMDEKEESICTVDTMSQAFTKYGMFRPKEVQPIQEKSAALNSKKKA